jgi:predicted transcriptional regulator
MERIIVKRLIMEKVNGKESKDIFKKYEISELEIKAIDEAFEDITNGKVQSHQEVMKETKKRFPHLFNRCD